MDFTTARYTRTADGIACFELATPAAMNAIDERRIAEFEAMLTDVESDPAVRALIISAQGNAFCVGLHLDLLIPAFADLDYFQAVLRRLADALLRLERLPVPTICAVQGLARAGGFETALACDFILVAEEAKVGDNHAHAGIMPGGGSTQRLARRIGMQRAKEIVFSSKLIGGAEAAAIGLALRAVPRAALAEAAFALARQFTDKPRACLAAIKRTMMEGAELPIAEGVALEIRNFRHYTETEPYAREGFAQVLKQVRG